MAVAATPCMKGLLISARQLLRAPGFLTLATLALALGIGSTTTIFSIVRAVFLRALPYSEPETLMQLTSSVKEQQIENAGFSYPRYEAVRDRQTAFSAMSYAIGTAFTVTGTPSPSRSSASRRLTTTSPCSACSPSSAAGSPPTRIARAVPTWPCSAMACGSAGSARGPTSWAKPSSSTAARTPSWA
jgi:hypothetical protein